MKKKHAILTIFIVGFFVYFNSLFNNFVWDDEEQIVKNTVIHTTENLAYLFRSGTFYGGGAGLSGWFYRPLVTLYYMLNYRIFKLNPFGYHLFQLFLHLVNATLVFIIFENLFKEEKVKKAKTFSFLVGLLFVIHPAIVEGVSYIASIGEVLYTFFTLVTFWLLLRSYAKPGFSKVTITMFSLILFLALISKESAAATIPIIWFYLLLFRRQKKAYFWVAATFGVIALYLYIRLVVVGLPISHPRYAPIAEAPFIHRLLTVPYELFSYILLLFLPFKLSISQHFVVTKFSDFRFWGLSCMILLFFIITLWLYIKTKSKVLLFSLFWFLISIGVVLNIFPLDMTIAERWYYFPIIGLLGVLGFALSQFCESRIYKIYPGIFLILGVCWVIFLSLRTVVRNTNWRDGLTLYSHDIKISQNSFDLENNLGVELFRVGDFKEAKRHFERSIKLQPKWWFAHNNLGAVYQREGDLEKARDLYETCIGLADYYIAYENLSFILLKVEEPQKSIEFIEDAVLKFPQNGKIMGALALSYYETDDYKKAEVAAQRAYLLEPSRQNALILDTIINRGEVEY